jgi:hypothetical protein
MTNRTTRLLLHSTSLACLGVSAGVLLLACSSPSLTPPAASVPAASAEIAPARIARGLSDFEPLWHKSLGPAAPSPAPSAKKAEELEMKEPADAPGGAATALGVQLIGTVLEKGRSLAVLIDAQGNIVLRSAGEELSGEAGSVRVERIEWNQVTLSGDGRRATLHMPVAEVP